MTKTQEPQTIKAILQQYADSHSCYTDWFDENEGTNKVESGVTDEILKTLKNILTTPEQEERWMMWAVRIANNRIGHILTNKHRRAYGRAAEILGALAEYHLIKNNRAKAATLIQENRDKKYNRFPAFKQELKNVMGSSKLLRELY